MKSKDQSVGERITTWMLKTLYAFLFWEHPWWVKFSIWYQTKVYYLRYKGNWHRHPWISRMMCGMGRHDYEAVSADKEKATLECFYCLKRKQSHFPHYQDTYCN